MIQVTDHPDVANHAPPGRLLPRRTFLLGPGALAAGALTACSPQRPEVPATASGSPQLDPTPDGSSRVLLAYFSRAGENYHYGGRRDLPVGNTEVVANLIAERLPVDLFRIQAQDPYPAAYQATVARNVREQQDDARPALASPPPSLAGYDTVLLGSPVWNVRAPMIMHTLLRHPCRQRAGPRPPGVRRPPACGAICRRARRAGRGGGSSRTTLGPVATADRADRLTPDAPSPPSGAAPLTHKVSEQCPQRIVDRTPSRSRLEARDARDGRKVTACHRRVTRHRSCCRP